MRRFFPSLLLALLSACHSVVGMEEVAGVYVLESVNGSPPPAVWSQNQFVTVEVLADTIWLFSDGRGVQRVAHRYRRRGEAERTERTENPFDYTLPDGRLEISFECRDVILLSSCAAPPHAVGRFSGDRLRLTAFFDNEVVYRRL